MSDSHEFGMLCPHPDGTVFVTCYNPGCVWFFTAPSLQEAKEMFYAHRATERLRASAAKG